MSNKHGKYIVIVWDGLWTKYGQPVDTEDIAYKIRDHLVKKKGKKPEDVRITRLSNK